MQVTVSRHIPIAQLHLWVTLQVRKFTKPLLRSNSASLSKETWRGSRWTRTWTYTDRQTDRCNSSKWDKARDGKEKRHSTCFRLQSPRAFLYQEKGGPDLTAFSLVRLWTSNLISVNSHFLIYTMGKTPLSNSTYPTYSHQVEASNHLGLPETITWK